MDLQLLIINPNTTRSITESLRPVVHSVLDAFADPHGDFYITADYFTAPSSSSSTPASITLDNVDSDAPSIEGIASIDSPDDALLSAKHCIPYIRRMVKDYDGFLIACYSDHPLVEMVQQEISALENKPQDQTLLPVGGKTERRKYVTGILEASVLSSLEILSRSSGTSQATFGIVSTGKIWEKTLSEAVDVLLGAPCPQFAGVETTGITAVQLHALPEAEVRAKMSEAAMRLASSHHSLKAICLGCAGMTGLEAAVRQGVLSAFGEGQGREIVIVDGVKEGVLWLVRMLTQM